MITALHHGTRLGRYTTMIVDLAVKNIELHYHLLFYQYGGNYMVTHTRYLDNTIELIQYSSDKNSYRERVNYFLRERDRAFEVTYR